MAKSVFILAGLLFSLTQPQIVEQSNFKLENKEVYYERVFEVKNTSSEELVKTIENRMKTVFDIENIEVDKNTISAESSKLLINYKKYHKKSMKTWRVLNCNTASKITIKVEPNKYTLLIKDIEFSCGLPVPAVYTLKNQSTKRGIQFKNSQINTDGLNYLDNYFRDTFDFTQKGAIVYN